MENCCKNCKHRLGDKGREREVIINGKYPLKIFSNCAKFCEMADFGFDPSPTCGVSIAFKADHSCKHFEVSGKTEQVTGSLTGVVDFSEPRPSRYEKNEEDYYLSMAKDIKKEGDFEKLFVHPEPPHLPEPDEGYDDGDIPF